ncbi:ABC transporter permease [Scopulibacillus cellulosilyticus]|uniref:ABC transporter permease n=1 Tax=Scopulibacillus cellulosilyticus TaxID=2665665 RepID=A0ABW2PWZ1_9BACL
MATKAILKRQLIQITHDIWTLILLIIAPLLVIFFSNVFYLNHIKPHTAQWFFQSGSLLCVLSFIFPCLTAAIAMLRDKKLGTLELTLMAPVTRGQVILGYLIGIGIIFAAQTLILLLFSIFIFHWSFSWTFILLYILLLIESITAIEIGLFIAACAKNPLKIFLYMTVIIILQIINWGQTAGWLPVISIIIPVNYSVDSVTSMFLHGYILSGFFLNIAALIVFCLLFFTLNIWVLQKIRRV